MTHEYMITGMTCSSCAARIKGQLLRLGDVTSVDVQLNPPQARVTMNKRIPTKLLQVAIAKAGLYTIIQMEQGKRETVAMTATNDTGASYYPMLLIFVYITGLSLLIQLNDESFNPAKWMQYFMAGFFLVFSFFKLMNLRGFADSYLNYDIVAKKFPVWGFIYPFIELALGIAYLISFELVGTNIAAFIIMTVSCIGVLQSLLRKNSFECGCLGTVIRLPLGHVSLMKDMLMVAMSGSMLIMFL